MSSLITGMGCVSAAGRGCEETIERLYSEPVDPRPSALVRSRVESPVFEVTGFTSPSGESAGRTLGLLEVAIEEALSMAGLTRTDLGARRIGISIGTTVACQLNDVDFYRSLRETGSAPPEPLLAYLGGNPSEWFRRRLGLCGPALTVVNACASGVDAIGLAGTWISRGRCDIAIAGGGDEITRVSLAGFHALGVCSDRPCAPFDAARDGLNLGEGAGVVILESASSAMSRGREADLQLAGYASIGDAHHITEPKSTGEHLEKAIREAMKRAGAHESDIAFVNAHGTGTALNDRVEGSTLARVFGPRVRYLSTKRFTGHTLGAAGALEFIFTGLMLTRGVAGVSAGFRNLPEDIAVAPLQSNTPVDQDFALSTSLAFGGCNSAVVLRRLAS